MPFSNKLHHWFLVSVIEIDPFASGKKEGTPGFEPGICWSAVSRSNHWAMYPCWACNLPAIIIVWITHTSFMSHRMFRIICPTTCHLNKRFTRGCIEHSVSTIYMHIAHGLLRELNPGSLAPEARIMPLDQAANEKVDPWQWFRCTCNSPKRLCQIQFPMLANTIV